MSRAFVTIRTEADREKVIRWARGVPVGTRTEWNSPRRSLEQNKIMWARLGEIARQVDWYGDKLTDEDWKDVFSASLKKARIVPGIDGGFVQLGLHTSELSKEEMSNLLDLIDAFAAEHGVTFKETELA